MRQVRPVNAVPAIQEIGAPYRRRPLAQPVDQPLHFRFPFPFSCQVCLRWAAIIAFAGCATICSPPAMRVPRRDNRSVSESTVGRSLAMRATDRGQAVSGNGSRAPRRAPARARPFRRRLPTVAWTIRGSRAEAGASQTGRCRSHNCRFPGLAASAVRAARAPAGRENRTRRWRFGPPPAMSGVTRASCRSRHPGRRRWPTWTVRRAAPHRRLEWREAAGACSRSGRAESPSSASPRQGPRLRRVGPAASEHRADGGGSPAAGILGIACSGYPGRGVFGDADCQREDNDPAMPHDQCRVPAAARIDAPAGADATCVSIFPVRREGCIACSGGSAFPPFRRSGSPRDRDG